MFEISQSIEPSIGPEVSMITIIDYGMGNIGSVENMLRRYRIPYAISSDPSEIERAGKLLLPGVGAFDAGVLKLRNSGIWTAMEVAVRERNAHFLGVCLGMQLLAKGSEEGDSEGLGWIDAVANRFVFAPGETDGRFPPRVPHMAWRSVTVTGASALLKGIQDPRFYFVHSYYIPAGLPETAAEARHAIPFSAVVETGNVYGAQFHPEKSHGFGLAMLRNYAGL